MRWLLEPEVFQTDSTSLIEYLEESGVNHTICKFGKSYEEYIEEIQRIDNSDCIVFHGSLQFARLILRQTKWIGVYCNLPKFECLYYYPRFGDYLLNSEYMMLPFGCLKDKKDWIFDNFGGNTRPDSVFLRPSNGSKTFTGKARTKDSWDNDIDLLSSRSDPELLVVIAPCKNIQKEWRLVVAENKVIAGSQYSKQGESVRIEGATQEVFEYAEDVLESVKYEPDPIWTLDICENHGELKVLEVGSFSCAGLYDCDPEPIVKAVNSIVLREWQDLQPPS